MASILWFITILLVLAWLLGFAVNIGAWINFLIVLAVIVLIFNLITSFVYHDHHDVHYHD